VLACRAPDEVQLNVPVVGRLDVPTAEMEKLLSFRVNPNAPNGMASAPVTAREELIKLTQLCKQQMQHIERLRQMQFSALKAASLDMVVQVSVFCALAASVDVRLRATQMQQQLVSMQMQVCVSCCLCCYEAHMMRDQINSELAALDMLRNLVLLDSLEMYQMHFLEGHFRLLLAHIKVVVVLSLQCDLSC
jgi:hypothetical protein